MHANLPDKDMLLRAQPKPDRTVSKAPQKGEVGSHVDSATHCDRVVLHN